MNAQMLLKKPTTFLSMLMLFVWTLIFLYTAADRSISEGPDYINTLPRRRQRVRIRSTSKIEASSNSRVNLGGSVLAHMEAGILMDDSASLDIKEIRKQMFRKLDKIHEDDRMKRRRKDMLAKLDKLHAEGLKAGKDGEKSAKQGNEGNKLNEVDVKGLSKKDVRNLTEAITEKENYMSNFDNQTRAMEERLGGTASAGRKNFTEEIGTDGVDKEADLKLQQADGEGVEDLHDEKNIKDRGDRRGTDDSKDSIKANGGSKDSERDGMSDGIAKPKSDASRSSMAGANQGEINDKKVNGSKDGKKIQINLARQRVQENHRVKKYNRIEKNGLHYTTRKDDRERKQGSTEIENEADARKGERSQESKGVTEAGGTKDSKARKMTQKDKRDTKAKEKTERIEAREKVDDSKMRQRSDRESGKEDEKSDEKHLSRGKPNNGIIGTQKVEGRNTKDDKDDVEDNAAGTKEGKRINKDVVQQGQGGKLVKKLMKEKGKAKSKKQVAGKKIDILSRNFRRQSRGRMERVSDRIIESKKNIRRFEKEDGHRRYNAYAKAVNIVN